MKQDDTEYGLPLKLNGTIDWALLGRAWAEDAGIGPIHDQPRPVRLPGDPRSDTDRLIYGEALIRVGDRMMRIYLD